MAGKKRHKVLELFAGAGGMAIGLHLSGFHHFALFEKDRNAVSTLRCNADSGAGVLPEVDIVPTDVRKVPYRNLANEVSVLAAGAPCQPFSLAGNHLGTEDDRNLFPEVFRAQRELVPRAVFLENVWGLARPSFRPYLHYILLQLAFPYCRPRRSENWGEHKVRLESAFRRNGARNEPTYDVRIAAVECANFGVPQRRHRLFIVAIRTDIDVTWTWPAATHSADALLYAKYSSGSYWSEHGLRPQRDPELERQATLLAFNGLARWRTVRDVLCHLPAPTPSGEPYHPNHYRIDGCRPYRGHTGSLMDEPSKTLKAGVHGVPGGENMIRLSTGSLRYFSLHESALLQTFPRAYVFRGARSSVIRQIGNAAPVSIVHLLGDQLRRLISVRSWNNSAKYRTPAVDLVDGAPLLQL